MVSKHHSSLPQRLTLLFGESVTFKKQMIWVNIILFLLFFFRYTRYYLFYEKIITFMQVSSDPNVAVKLELVSEEKGTCTELNQPEGIKCQ